MITKDEIASIMELTTYQIIRARENAVTQDRSRLRAAVSAEIKNNLDPEWNYAMERVLELIDTQLPPLHPVVSAEEISKLTTHVAEKIQRLIPKHDGTF